MKSNPLAAIWLRLIMALIYTAHQSHHQQQQRTLWSVVIEEEEEVMGQLTTVLRAVQSAGDNHHQAAGGNRVKYKKLEAFRDSSELTTLRLSHSRQPHHSVTLASLRMVATTLFAPFSDSRNHLGAG